MKNFLDTKTRGAHFRICAAFSSRGGQDLRSIMRFLYLVTSSWLDFSMRRYEARMTDDTLTFDVIVMSVISQNSRTPSKVCLRNLHSVRRLNDSDDLPDNQAKNVWR